MKANKLFIAHIIGLFINVSVLILVPSITSCIFASTSLLQNGNSIGGFVFDSQRQPVNEAIVELLDDFSRSIARTRTSSSGRYLFTRIPAGRYRIRVLSTGLNFQEQEQDVEIQNITREIRGELVTTGFENAQKDFYLKPRKDSQQLGSTEAVFAQEIPQQAQEAYNNGVAMLNTDKESDGLKKIKSAIEIFPDYYAALDRLGSEYVRLKHFVPAQILLQRAVEVNPRSYRSWYGLAYALYSQNKNSEALVALEKANSLNQNSVESALLTGVLLKQTGNFEQSEKHLKRAKELSKGSNAEVHWQLALLYGNNLKRYREAASELELFLKIQPDNKNAENIKKLIAQFKSKSQEKSQNQ